MLPIIAANAVAVETGDFYFYKSEHFTLMVLILLALYVIIQSTNQFIIVKQEYSHLLGGR